MDSILAVYHSDILPEILANKVSKNLRIKYQLHKQGLTISKLLEQRDENGEERTEESREIYMGEKKRDYREAQINRYMTYLSKENKLPQNAYEDLCKILRIEPQITRCEQEEIQQWLHALEDAEIGFKKRIHIPKGLERKDVPNKERYKYATKPTIQVTSERQRLAQETSIRVQEKYYEEEYLINEESEKYDDWRRDEFISHTGNLCWNVVYIWHEFADFFTSQFLEERIFLHMYSSLNSIGKKLFHEVILLYFESDDYFFTDESTALYDKMKHMQVPECCKGNIKLMANEIYDRWAYGFTIEELGNFQELADIILNCKQEDWQCLIDYHRIRVLGEELLIEGKSFIDYLNKAFYLIADAPSIR